MKKFNIVDLHCDTLMGCYRGMPLAKNDGHIDLEKLQKGGALAQFFAIWIPTGPSAERHGVHEGPYPYFQHTYEAYLREMELNKAVIAPALCYADIQKNLAEGKISSILTIEDGGSVFEGKMERLEEAYQKGVRLITLTWFYENCIGFPCSKDRPDLMDMGLKPFGIDAVRRMNELGIVVDVSHLSDGGFWDVVKYSTKPFVASHSCCRALAGHPRDLSDEMLRALAEKGGAIGVNFCTNFLVDGGAPMSRIDDVVRHLKHMLDVAGEDAPAFGSDFDGIDDQLEWKDYAGMPLIVDALGKAGFTERQIDKICHENALRIVKEVIG